MRKSTKRLNQLQLQPSEWEEEWHDMPEFKQNNKVAIHHLTVNFETLEDMQKFGELVGTTITQRTRGLYFPVKKLKVKRSYTDES